MAGQSTERQLNNLEKEAQKGDGDVRKKAEVAESAATVESESLIAHVALPIGDSVLMGGDDLERMDGLPPTDGASLIRLEPENAAEAEKAFDALADGGEVLMALREVDWAEKHGWCVDRFRIRWMVDYPGDVEAAG